ncbi:MAG: hypothetical protein ACI4RB_03985 [Acutalibacteraceae bacterium]
MNEKFDIIKNLLSDYDYKELDTDDLVFKKIFKVTVKKLIFKETFFVTFVNLELNSQLLEQVNADFEKFLNRSKLDCCSLLCIFEVENDVSKDSYTYYFNGEILSFVHPLLISKSESKIYFDKDFHYQGDKEIKKLVKKIKEALNI